MASLDFVARQLAATLLAGAWTPRAMQRRMEALLGPRAPKTQRRLLHEISRRTQTEYPPAPARLAQIILGCPAFARAAGAILRANRPMPAVLTPAKFAPVAHFSGLSVPQIATARGLAEWLDLSIEQLDWLADSRQMQGRTATPALQHYTYAFAPKRSGKLRLIEAPKSRLKAIQRKILREILDLVPAHDSAHGFVAGRSCLSAAQMHASEFVVAAFDLTHFFPSVALARAGAFFRSLGYPSDVARLLLGLCSTSTPRDVLAQAPGFDWQDRKLYGAPHLAQGAPTSPALANACAWRLDQRLHRLASRMELNYARYADDLSFSGGERFARIVGAFQRTVETIVVSEGFTLNKAKTRVMRASGRQRVAGVVVNQHVNVPRPYFDELKAILHNCGRHGPAAQDREGRRDFRAHLDGRVGWVESVNPGRGARLRELFDAIAW